MKITRFLDYGSSYSAETNPRKESIPNADNLNKGFCYRSYSFQREGLNGLNFDLQLSESGNVERERKRWFIDACLYFYHITFSLVFFFYHLVFLSFLFPLYSFLPLLLALLFFFPPTPQLFMATPFYTVCHYGIYPFYPSTIFGFSWASLQDCPLNCWLSSHYLCPKCAGYTTLHF